MQGLLGINVCSLEWLLDDLLFSILIRFDSRLFVSSLLVWIKVRRSSTSIFPLYCEDPSDTLIEWKIRQLFDILVIVRLALCAGLWAAFQQQSTMSNVSSSLRSLISTTCRLLLNMTSCTHRDQISQKHSSQFYVYLIIITSLTISLVWVSNAVSVWSSADSVTQCDNVLEKLINYPWSCWSML